MRVTVDPGLCIGCTLCAQVCPEVFKMEIDKAIAYTDPVPEAFQADCREAASQCPVDAITIQP